MNASQPEVADDITQERQHRRPRRIWIGTAVFLASLGVINFSGFAGQARFETYHSLDVARLMISGAAFGVALFVSIQLFKGSCPR